VISVLILSVSCPFETEAKTNCSCHCSPENYVYAIVTILVLYAENSRVHLPFFCLDHRYQEYLINSSFLNSFLKKDVFEHFEQFTVNTEC